MKKLVVIVALFISFVSNATNYYFSSVSGNDSRTNSQAQSPSTPLQSISRLNTLIPSLQTGDSVLFKGGETFFTTAPINAAAKAFVSYSSYGTGKATITGYIDFTGTFLNDGLGVWHVNLDVPYLQVVSYNNKLVGMGRYPNAPNYITFTGSGTTVVNNGTLTVGTSISGTQIGAMPNSFVGGIAMVRKARYYLDKQRILSRVGNTLNLDWQQFDNQGFPGGVAQNDNGYFVEDHLSTLDIDAEWYYDKANKRLKVFCGSNINTKYIRAAAGQIGFQASGGSNLSFTNLRITGFNQSGIAADYSTNITVLNCDVIDIGGNGFEASQGPGGARFYNTHDVIYNNTFKNCLNSGIIAYERSGVSVWYNNLDSIGMIMGMSKSGDAAGNGMQFYGDNLDINYNTVTNTCYSGIATYAGSNWLIHGNYVNGTNIVKDDGGGIYQYGIDSTWKSNREISNNIVLNSRGNYDGGLGFYASFQANGAAFGIYLDNFSDHVTIKNNYVAHIAAGAFHNSSFCHDNSYLDNTAFDFDHGILFLDLNQGYGSTTRNVVVKRNIFIMKAGQYAYNVETYNGQAVIPNFGDFNDNVFAKPEDPNGYIIWRSDRTGGAYNNTFHTLAQWRTLYSNKYDATSSLSAITLTDINNYREDFNITGGGSGLSLPNLYKSVKSNTAFSSLFLPPYSGAVSFYFAPNPNGGGNQPNKQWKSGTGKAWKDANGRLFKTP